MGRRRTRVRSRGGPPREIIRKRRGHWEVLLVSFIALVAAGWIWSRPEPPAEVVAVATERAGVAAPTTAPRLTRDDEQATSSPEAATTAAADTAAAGRTDAVASPAASGGSVRALDLLQRGRRALDERRFKRAVGLLEGASPLLPDNVDVHYLLGRAYWGEDRPYAISPEKAMRAFERAVTLDPGLRTEAGRLALRALAVTYVRNERMPEARRAYASLLERDPDQSRHNGYRAQIDEIDLDLGVYQPGPDAIFNAKGEFLAPLGPTGMRTNQPFEKGRHTQDPAKAEVYYKAAMVTDPLLHQAYNNVGMSLVNRGRYREAIPYLEESDRVFRIGRESAGHPYARAHTWLIRCYVELGDLAKAAEHWQIVQGLPGFDNWTSLWGLRLAVETGQAAEAVPLLETAAAGDPEHVEILHTLALAYAALDRYGEAAETMAEAIDAIPPGHHHFRHLLAPYDAQLADWRERATSRQ